MVVTSCAPVSNIERCLCDCLRMSGGCARLLVVQPSVYVRISDFTAGLLGGFEDRVVQDGVDVGAW